MHDCVMMYGLFNMRKSCYKFLTYPLLQAEEEVEWSVLKPDIFASIMDFFASNVPILTEDQPASDTGKNNAIERGLIKEISWKVEGTVFITKGISIQLNR